MKPTTLIESLDVTEGSEFVLLVAPVFFHLHVKFQKDFLLKEFLNVLTGFYSHPLDHLALMANDDALLGVSLHIDDCHDVDGRVALVKLLNDDLRGIGHFLVIGHEDFLADDLGDKESAAAVGQSILPKVGRALGQ